MLFQPADSFQSLNQNLFVAGMTDSHAAGLLKAITPALRTHTNSQPFFSNPVIY
jgi:hypothetical protein